MSINKFLISDASYSYNHKCAGLGVLDLYSGKKYRDSLVDIQSSETAEYRALLLSVRIALKNNYEDVVFVYDCKNLNLESLKLWLDDKIKSYQFLWLKREYVKEADKLARKARVLQQKLPVLKGIKLTEDGKNLLKMFKEYSRQKILIAFRSIATKNERIVLSTLIKNEKYSPILIDESSLDFYSDVYHLIKKDKSKKTFFKYINKNFAGNINHARFFTQKSQEHYIELVQNIVQTLSNKQ